MSIKMLRTAALVVLLCAAAALAGHHKLFDASQLRADQSHLHKHVGAAPLNVFVVPHTHDDVGWVNTPDVRVNSREAPHLVAINLFRSL